jgi:hypothetical protein
MVSLVSLLLQLGKTLDEARPLFVFLNNNIDHVYQREVLMLTENEALLAIEGLLVFVRAGFVLAMIENDFFFAGAHLLAFGLPQVHFVCAGCRHCKDFEWC